MTRTGALRFGILLGSCLMAAAAVAQPARPGGEQGGQDSNRPPPPMCVPLTQQGQKAARPCPLPPPPRAGVAPLKDGAPCKCGPVPGKVRNGPPGGRPPQNGAMPGQTGGPGGSGGQNGWPAPPAE